MGNTTRAWLTALVRDCHIHRSNYGGHKQLHSQTRRQSVTQTLKGNVFWYKSTKRCQHTNFGRFSGIDWNVTEICCLWI